jgi:pimeloyl-ACP methyl ester carboxylesterase
MVALTVGEPVMRAVSRAARLVPERRVPWVANVLLDTVRQDPAPSAAVLQGLFFHRVAPPRALRRTIGAPTLVIGHPRDPVHPFNDAGELVEDLPDARLLRSSSIAELFVTPERLTGEISGFLDEVWQPAAARQRRHVA